MRILQPTGKPRLNEPVGFVLLALAIALALSLISHQTLDPSWNVAGAEGVPANLIGFPGAYGSDLLLQGLGLGAFVLPFFLALAGWHWVRSSPIRMLFGRLLGAALLLASACTALSLYSAQMRSLWSGSVHPGGVLGEVLSLAALSALNQTGALILLSGSAIVSLYLLTSFELGAVQHWAANGSAALRALGGRWTAWRERSSQGLQERARRKQISVERRPRAAAETGGAQTRTAETGVEARSFGKEDGELPPIIPYESHPVSDAAEQPPFPDASSGDLDREPEQQFGLAAESEESSVLPRRPRTYRLPSTLLLRPGVARSEYDEAELQEVARQICTKFEEFHVGGAVTRINPGPVVTTFEFKPSPGIKYTRIVNLSEDLCLALECESIMVERIPGKSTVGIEVPNRKRDVISFREIIEAPEFTRSESLVTMAVGKDINGRIKVTNLASMPHLLIAGSTGSGKSVLINTIIMSILYKANPDQVRFIFVDPKTVELGLYADIPHLLTPVITDMKKASNALKNATIEMERRLKLLAQYSVRNLDQYNEKIAKLLAADPDYLDEQARQPERLPYIVIVIDELADLMMLEGRQIEESITRLAQMSRAVGIHLILATQRPSVDVITGLIKANIPARISFRLATRVDSRTILDSMGAEALLGRGDMLFLPPGSGRMVRLHGPLVSEDEIEAVVQTWKEQGAPEYEKAFLAPPPDSEAHPENDDEGFDDPAYENAIRIVLEMGKASTSTLQRRLRLGYGRAARILDAMERDGIIGPLDGSRPREVLKRPDWLVEVEQ